MRDFQWLVSEFFLWSLRNELVVTLIVLLAVLATTAVLVGIELRRNKDNEHADK